MIKSSPVNMIGGTLIGGLIIRVTVSCAVLACRLPKEPSWPVFMAVSSVAASEPRTSPTMMRSGRMRRLDFRQSFMSTSGVPSGRSRRVSMRSQWSW